MIESASADSFDIVRLLLAFALVMGLMGALAWALKKLGLAQNMSVKSGAERRLKIIESLPLDPRRRIIIVQCDEREHLVLLGVNSDTVIAHDIHRPVDSSPKPKRKT